MKLCVNPVCPNIKKSRGIVVGGSHPRVYFECKEPLAGCLRGLKEMEQFCAKRDGILCKLNLNQLEREPDQDTCQKLPQAVSGFVILGVPKTASKTVN